MSTISSCLKDNSMIWCSDNIVDLKLFFLKVYKSLNIEISTWEPLSSATRMSFYNCTLQVKLFCWGIPNEIRFLCNWHVPIFFIQLLFVWQIALKEYKYILAFCIVTPHRINSHFFVCQKNDMGVLASQQIVDGLAAPDFRYSAGIKWSHFEQDILLSAQEN